jgi:hypothetical protein
MPKRVRHKPSDRSASLQLLDRRSDLATDKQTRELINRLRAAQPAEADEIQQLLLAMTPEERMRGVEIHRQIEYDYTDETIPPFMFVIRSMDMHEAGDDA